MEFERSIDMGQIVSLAQIRTRHRREQRLWLTLRYLRAQEERDYRTAILILVIALGDRELRELLTLAEQPPVEILPGE
jgi:hypothetical protein